jgi:hypothetical protein
MLVLIVCAILNLLGSVYSFADTGGRRLEIWVLRIRFAAPLNSFTADTKKTLGTFLMFFTVDREKLIGRLMAWADCLA